MTHYFRYITNDLRSECDQTVFWTTDTNFLLPRCDTLKIGIDTYQRFEETYCLRLHGRLMFFNPTQMEATDSSKNWYQGDKTHSIISTNKAAFMLITKITKSHIHFGWITLKVIQTSENQQHNRFSALSVDFTDASKVFSMNFLCLISRYVVRQNWKFWWHWRIRHLDLQHTRQYWHWNSASFPQSKIRCLGTVSFHL